MQVFGKQRWHLQVKAWIKTRILTLEDIWECWLQLQWECGEWDWETWRRLAARLSGSARGTCQRKPVWKFGHASCPKALSTRIAHISTITIITCHNTCRRQLAISNYELRITNYHHCYDYLKETIGKGEDSGSQMAWTHLTIPAIISHENQDNDEDDDDVEDNG